MADEARRAYDPLPDLADLLVFILDAGRLDGVAHQRARLIVTAKGKA